MCMKQRQCCLTCGVGYQQMSTRMFFYSGVSWKQLSYIDSLTSHNSVTSHMFPLSGQQWHKVKTFISSFIANKCQSRVQLMLSDSSMSPALSLQAVWTMKSVLTLHRKHPTQSSCGESEQTRSNSQAEEQLTTQMD